MNNIPIDIVNIIIEFAFKKCEKCNEIKHFPKTKDTFAKIDF